MGKTLEAKKRKNAVLFIAFLSYSLSRRVIQWDLSPLQAPKPLGLERQVLHVQVALGGRLSGETKMASLWAKLTPYCGIEISENKSLRG